jgi:hypothetical protein
MKMNVNQVFRYMFIAGYQYHQIPMLIPMVLDLTHVANSTPKDKFVANYNYVPKETIFILSL